MTHFDPRPTSSVAIAAASHADKLAATTTTTTATTMTTATAASAPSASAAAAGRPSTTYREPARSIQRSHTVGFPVFCVVFSPSPLKFFVGGGGGATKAGVKNTAILYDISPNDLDISIASEHLFTKEDDGCMNIAVHPKEKAFIAAVNYPERDVRSGNNQSGRVFLISKSRMRWIKSIKTTDSTDPFHHQKVARFSADGKLLCTGTTDGKFCIWTWPELEIAFPPMELGTEINDIHIDPLGSCIGFVTPFSLRILDMAKAKVRWELGKQTIGAEICEFRALRFGVKKTQGILFVVLNARSRKGAFIQKYSISEQRAISTTPVSMKPITAFALSPDGSLIAFGSSDQSVTVLSAHNFSRIMRIDDAHSFPVTSVDINVGNLLLVSGSADGTCMLATIPRLSKPRHGRGNRWSCTWMFFVNILFGLCIVIVLLLLIDFPDDEL